MFTTGVTLSEFTKLHLKALILMINIIKRCFIQKCRRNWKYSYKHIFVFSWNSATCTKITKKTGKGTWLHKKQVRNMIYTVRSKAVNYKIRYKYIGVLRLKRAIYIWNYIWQNRSVFNEAELKWCLDRGKAECEKNINIFVFWAEKGSHIEKSAIQIIEIILKKKGIKWWFRVLAV